MSPETTLDFPDYDPGLAAAMTGNSASAHLRGLPAYLGMEVTEVAAGYLACRLEVTDELLNPFGAAHGGVVSALVDHVLGAVCLPVVASGSWPATSEYKINMVAPARVGSMLAESRIVSLSRRTAVVRVDISNEGRLIAAAQGTVAIMAPRP